MGRGATRLRDRRPGWVSQAGSSFFAEQGVAAANRAYGAVGGPDYVVEAIVDRSRVPQFAKFC